MSFKKKPQQFYSTMRMTVDVTFVILTSVPFIAIGLTGGCTKGGPGQYGAVQCVRDYLVCDGSADCKSGADEADDVCRREY